MENRALIIGAGSAIASALRETLLTESQFHQIVCVSRNPRTEVAGENSERLQWLESDYSATSIERVCSRVRQYQGSFSRVIICNGVLHDGDLKPEKRLEDLTSDSLHELFHANAVVPALWLKNLRPVLVGKRSTKVAVFSARVGSIEDNRRGGWYGYRASKAALNMLVRTAAIEYERRAPNVQFMVFHPGTTDTPLSKPFQKSVPPEKLFQPAFVADRLLSLMAGDEQDEQIRFVDWQGKAVAW